jgi:LysR family glycine cleavage system transcriptional activator
VGPVTRRLPPLNQLRAFEAAARHISFKDAADELNVTHAAVSQQIRALEDLLGSQLFQRIPRGVRLTDAARELSADLTTALDRMDAAVSRFTANGMQGTIRISVVPLYANRFLVPSLPKFSATNPGLNVDLEFSYELVDLANSDCHAALRHGFGDWPNLTDYRLHSDILTPVCAPELIAGQEFPVSAEQISRMNLAVARGYEKHWHEWFHEAGVADNFEPNFVIFDSRVLAVEFATAGNGVVLSDVHILKNELQSGQLVRLHPLVKTFESGIFLVFPETPYPDPRLLLIAEWISGLFSFDESPETEGQSGLIRDSAETPQNAKGRALDN